MTAAIRRLLPVSTPNASIEAILVSYECFDLFTDPSGQKIAADRKSIAYRFLYRAADKTLKTNEIDEAHKRVLELLGKIEGLAFRQIGTGCRRSFHGDHSMEDQTPSTL